MKCGVTEGGLVLGVLPQGVGCEYSRRAPMPFLQGPHIQGSISWQKKKEAKVSQQQSNYRRHTMGLIQPLKLTL